MNNDTAVPRSSNDVDAGTSTQGRSLCSLVLSSSIACFNQGAASSWMFASAFCIVLAMNRFSGHPVLRLSYIARTARSLLILVVT